MEKVNISDIDIGKLLNDKRVVAEIERHLWIESEKAGQNIGYEKAKEDWLKRFSKAWLEYHMPEELVKLRKPTENKPIDVKIKEETVQKKQSVTTPPNVKRRRAKSYFEVKQ